MGQKGGLVKQAPLIPDATERDPLDFNRTPAWCVELLIPHLKRPRTVLDVGCGDGAIGKVLRQAWQSSTVILGVEAHKARAALASAEYVPHAGHSYDFVWCDNWIDGAWDRATLDRPDLIISNPPFGLPALRFLELALQRVALGGIVAFLLPTHWDHDPDVESGFARQRFLDSLRLPDGREGYCKFAIVGGGKNPARPSFKRGGTASDRYAWFMFGEDWAGQPSRRLHAIPPPSTSPQLGLVVPPSEPTPPVPGATWNPLALEWEVP